MKYSTFLLILVFPLVAGGYSEDDGKDRSVSLINNESRIAEFWVNGEYRELDGGAALRVPCLPNENVEVHVGLELHKVSCGEVRELWQ